MFEQGPPTYSASLALDTAYAKKKSGTQMCRFVLNLCRAAVLVLRGLIFTGLTSRDYGTRSKVQMIHCGGAWDICEGLLYLFLRNCILLGVTQNMCELRYGGKGQTNLCCDEMMCLFVFQRL